MINEHIELGVLNTLKINRITEPGIYLEALDEEVILLPNAYVTKNMQVDDELEVFVYTDSEDRLVSTTQKPYGMKNEFMFTYFIDLMRETQSEMIKTQIQLAKELNLEYVED